MMLTTNRMLPTLFLLPSYCVLSVGAVFAIFSGFNQWYSLVTGYSLNSEWMKMHFLTTFVGVNMSIFPQHFLGLRGIPRRYSDYPEYYLTWYIISSLGSMIILVSTIWLIFIIWESLISTQTSLAPTNVLSSLEWFHNLPHQNIHLLNYP